MLTIKPLAIAATQSAGAYYAEDNYYTRTEGIEHSQWCGALSETLGLSGPVLPEDFARLLSGWVEGQQLGNVKDGAVRHRPGYDLTFSAPKSVSILGEVLGRQEVLAAHDEAVRETLAFFEQHYVATRLRRDGDAVLEPTAQALFAVFRHDVSRELDPQTHSHAVLLNVTQAEGAYRSIHPDVFLRQAKKLGYLYRVALADKLEAAGYRLQYQDQKNALFEVAQVSEAYRTLFAKRAEQIRAYIQKKGATYNSALARRAALITRQAKQSIERGALRDLWRAEIREAGLAPLRVMPRAPEKTTATTMDWEPLLRRAVRRLQSTDIAFTELDLLVSCREIIAAKKQTVDAFALANAVRAFVERGILLPSDAPRGKTDAYYTTKAAKRLEHQIVARLAASAQVFETGFMTQTDIEQCLSRYDGKAKPPRYRTLDAGQRQAIIEALSSRDRYHIIQGNAGSGKTTLLNELRQVMMKELGVLVRRSGALRALASTHVAANELQKSLGVTATTLDHFLVQKAEKNAQNEVWLVDEASMMDVKKLQALMDRAEAANARVILIGDANQLESVGPGRALYLTQKAGVQVSRVEKIYRQENDALREVAEHINAQQHVLALDKLNQMDGVRESSHVNTAILQHLSGLSGSAILEHVVVTPTNEDRMELTRGIRDVLQQKGVVQQQNVQMEAWVPRIIPEVELQYSDQYQVGDLLRFNRRLHVATSAWKTRLIKANEYYEVLGKTPEALLIRSHATGERFEFPVATLGDRSAGAVFVYEKNTTDLSVNDRLRWLDNRNDLGLKRNQVLTVVRVSADRVELAQGKRRITIDPRRLNHSHFEHAYAVTAQGAQGISAASVLVAAPWWRRNSVNQRSLLVGVTRAKQKLLVFTENLAKLKHEIGQRYADNSQALQQHERQRALGAFL